MYKIHSMLWWCACTCYGNLIFKKDFCLFKISIELNWKLNQSLAKLLNALHNHFKHEFDMQNSQIDHQAN